MSLSDVGSILSAMAAFAALIVALVSLRKTNQFNARQTELADITERLNTILIEREIAEVVAAKRADLSANLYKAGRGDIRMKVFNRGKAVARNVRLIDLDRASDTILMDSQIKEKFPLPILDCQQSAELITISHLGSKLRTHIKLIWDDDAGVDHEKELTPTL